MNDYSAGYFGGDGYDADSFEDLDDDYQPPQQRQRNAAKTPGLRAFLKQQAAELKQLKEQNAQQEAMLAELVGDAPQQSHGTYPTSRLTLEEQVQLQRLQSMGVVGVAPPQGTEADQIQAINQCKSPDELNAYLAGQGNQSGALNYSGRGW